MPVYKDKKTGKWYFAFRKVVEGITYNKKERGFNTKTEAMLAEAECVKRLGNKISIQIKESMLNDVFAKFIEYRKTNRKISTICLMEEKYSPHIKGCLGNRIVSSITVDEIKQWKLDLINKHLSESRTNGVISLLRQVLEYATRLNIHFDSSLIVELEPVRIDSIKHERPVWTLEEFQRFFDAFMVDNPKEKLYHDYFKCFFASGMRPNEFRALQVRDIRGNYLNVNHTIMSKKKGEKDIILSPKNKTSNRDVIMPDDIMKIILENCKGYNPTDYIFGKEIALRETTLRRYLVNHAKAAGLNPIPLHSFRHSHATHLIRSGVPIKIVSERLGHESVLTTLNIYTHIVKGDEATVLNYLNI